MAVAPLAALREEIAELVAGMCAAAAECLRGATVALRDDRERLATQIVARVEEIDALRERVERIAVTTVALHAPVAGNMRAVVAALRAADEVERMAALAAHVATAVRRRHTEGANGVGRVVPLPDEARDIFAAMGERGAAMADKAATVARTRDVLLALELEDDDEEIDAQLRAVFTMLLEPDWPHGVGPAVEITLLARYYERFADHAVAVAREIVYAVTGRSVEQVGADLAAGPELSP